MKRDAFSLSYFLLIIFYSLFASCKTTAQISRQAEKTLITDTAISKGFIGISVFDPSSNTYLYNYNADKYFVPASNVKLFTLYAGMKYLGDSLPAIYYEDRSGGKFNLFFTGDPTFLHPDFKNQPLLDFLKIPNREFHLSGYNNLYNRSFNALGYGWAWDDYSEDYMIERSQFPIYGNVFRAQYDTIQPFASIDSSKVKWKISPPYFTAFVDSINYYPVFELPNQNKKKFSRFRLVREIASNQTTIAQSENIFSSQDIPFVTNNIHTAISLLWHDFKIHAYADRLINLGVVYSTEKPKPLIPSGNIKVIHSQPSDSLFKPMMHRSDNFFAEQTLLMASNEHLGYMSDEAIIDTLLKTDLADAPQKPKWVDGSGLSRYNLFTPQDFIYILNKMKNEFGMERLKTILATGGEGTLKNYFKKDAGFIYAKTGTLSNNCALSGYIITKKNKLLIFSILANNYQTGATPVRKAVEKFVEYLRDTY